ncbi:MAG TPA: SH3 domain-containing protein [Phototrophicaceae bacterium]|nr:SH3 domain-containing protein [Phototrophicaceae bacterium]
MFKRIGLMMVVLLMLALAFAAQAQEGQTPLVVDAAIDALGEKVGQPLSLADITNYSWSGQVYPDTSLDCPQTGQTYAQVATRGLQFLLDYGSTTYDYRVSADGKIVILCDSYPVAQAAESTLEAGATPEATAAPVAAICAEPLPFTVGQAVQVVPNIGGVNVRETPNVTGKRMGRVVGGDTLTILAGPECGPRGLLWWQVQAADFQGWMAQGRGALNFLQVPGAEATPEATAAP